MTGFIYIKDEQTNEKNKIHSSNTTIVFFWGNAQQESSFSHYMYNHQAVNPGYVGSRGVTNFTSVLRSQWSGIEGAPLTQTLSYSGGFG